MGDAGQSSQHLCQIQGLLPIQQAFIFLLVPLEKSAVCMGSFDCAKRPFCNVGFVTYILVEKAVFCHFLRSASLPNQKLLPI